MYFGNKISIIIFWSDEDGCLVVTISVVTKLVTWIRYLRQALPETWRHLEKFKKKILLAELDFTCRFIQSYSIGHGARS